MSWNRPTTFWSGLDRLQLAAIAGLVLIGVTFVYSATTAAGTPGLWMQYQERGAAEFASWFAGQFVFRQGLWYGVGIGLATAVCLVDYRLFSRWAPFFYWAAIGTLILVLIPGIGAVRFGARRWIDLGLFQFQPSEFAKLAMILGMAQFLGRPGDELRRPWMLTKGLALMLLPFVLIMREPDLGSALVLLPTGLAMMFVAGVNRRKLVGLVLGVGLVGALLLADILFAPPHKFQIKLHEYQRERLLVHFGISDPPPAGATPADIQRLRDRQRDMSLNVRQALISVGSGGLTGKGWRRGTQNNLGYLPRAVAHNDFIFSVIAEESGFVGGVMVIALYGVVLFTGIRTASEARDRLGQSMAVGVVVLLFSHVFINIGMNIRIMPVTGVPLPLLSYGGSSVISSLVAMGLLQNVYIHRKIY
jgi:rod shape determining protein RodA